MAGPPFLGLLLKIACEIILLTSHLQLMFIACIFWRNPERYSASNNLPKNSKARSTLNNSGLLNNDLVLIFFF
jgi:hypothetical protein